jgi:hypothetical protein
VRLNLEVEYFGAILVDRGDRISWTGDAHVAQAASMAAFGNFDFVLHNLNRSATDCNGIESYCVYWCLSLLDYWRHTGDDSIVEYYIPNVNAKLEHAHDIFEARAVRVCAPPPRDAFRVCTRARVRVIRVRVCDTRVCVCFVCRCRCMWV